MKLVFFGGVHGWSFLGNVVTVNRKKLRILNTSTFHSFKVSNPSFKTLQLKHLEIWNFYPMCGSLNSYVPWIDKEFTCILKRWKGAFFHDFEKCFVTFVQFIKNPLVVFVAIFYINVTLGAMYNFLSSSQLCFCSLKMI